MAHEKLSLDLMDRIKRYADDEDYRGTAKIEGIDVHYTRHYCRDDRDHRKGDRTAERDTSHYLLYVVGGRFTGANAEDEPAVLLHIRRDVFRLEDYRRIEI